MSSVSQAVLTRAIEMLQNRPAALLTDVDGTLARIVPRPEDAHVEPDVAESLRKLHDLLDLVAIVTARPRDTARKMVGVPELTYVGHYGLGDHDGVGSTARLEKMKLFVKPQVKAFPCATFEDKGISFSVHYRNCSQPEEVRQQLLKLLEPVALQAGAKLVEGKKVIEMVPTALPDKGHAVRDLQRDHRLNGIVYLGDDIGDLAVFEELRRRRIENGLPSFAIAVVDTETDQRIIEAADATIPGVDAVKGLLAALAGAPELVAEASNARP